MSLKSSEESLEAYHTQLHQLSKHCEFHDVEKEIKRHIIKTCTSSHVRQKAIGDKITLTRLLDYGRNIEDVDHKCEMEKMTLYPHHISWLNSNQPVIRPISSAVLLRNRTNQ